MKQWNGEVFCQINITKEMDQIDEKQFFGLQRSSNMNCWIIQQEEVTWPQISWVKSLREGENNTKYFVRLSHGLGVKGR